MPSETLINIALYLNECAKTPFNPLNPELNSICYLLALLAHHFLHVSSIRVKSLTIRLLMSYIYIYIYDISNLRVKLFRDRLKQIDGSKADQS